MDDAPFIAPSLHELYAGIHDPSKHQRQIALFDDPVYRMQQCAQSSLRSQDALALHDQRSDRFLEFRVVVAGNSGLTFELQEVQVARRVSVTGEDRPDFLRRQVLTSRNVRGGRLTDVALGGLNHQIEHHLFPSMPSPNLRRARTVVRRYCEELGLDYVETGLLTSYRLALASLHRAGAPLRHPEAL